MAPSRPIEDRRRWTTFAILALVSLDVIAAGYGFVKEPSGASLGIPQSWLERSPFDDDLVPGAILLALGVLYGSAAVQDARRASGAWSWAGLRGGAMRVWIVVQVAMMGDELHPIRTTRQATILAAGLVTGTLAFAQRGVVRTGGRTP